MLSWVEEFKPSWVNPEAVVDALEEAQQRLDDEDWTVQEISELADGFCKTADALHGM